MRSDGSVNPTQEPILQKIAAKHKKTVAQVFYFLFYLFYLIVSIIILFFLKIDYASLGILTLTNHQRDSEVCDTCSN